MALSYLSTLISVVTPSRYKFPHVVLLIVLYCNFLGKNRKKTLVDCTFIFFCPEDQIHYQSGMF